MLFYTLQQHQHTILLFPPSLLSLSSSHQILSTLETYPLQSLRPSEKVSIISLLIEDLLGSPALCREVDTKMEQISTLRREKWKINLKLKRYARRGGSLVPRSRAPPGVGVRGKRGGCERESGWV